MPVYLMRSPSRRGLLDQANMRTISSRFHVIIQTLLYIHIAHVQKHASLG